MNLFIRRAIATTPKKAQTRKGFVSIFPPRGLSSISVIIIPPSSYGYKPHREILPTKQPVLPYNSRWYAEATPTCLHQTHQRASANRVCRMVPRRGSYSAYLHLPFHRRCAQHTWQPFV